jgi:hypothetical protein
LTASKSFVLGLTVLQGGVSLSLLAGVAVSNLRRQDQEPAQSVDATSGTRAKHAGVPLRRVRAGELRCEEFLYELKAGPAGGRLRRPSSAGNPPDGTVILLAPCRP